MIRKQAEAPVNDPDEGDSPDGELASGSHGDISESRRQAMGHVVFQIVLAAVVLAASVGITWLLVSLKTRPAEVPESRSAPIVLVERVSVGTFPTPIKGFGTVRATRQLALVPEVGGRVVEIHPGLVSGGTLEPGAVALRIDPTDFELALEQAQADLRRAEAALKRIDSRRRAAAAEVAARRTAFETAKAESGVARREFERLNPGQPIPPLVAREPQLAQAMAALEAGQAALEDVAAEEDELQAQLAQAATQLRQARVNLSRTELRLPADGTAWRVETEAVDVGQTVSTASPVAQLWDAGSLEVPVPLEDQQLQWIVFPGAPGTTTSRAGPDWAAGATALILDRYAGEAREWPARVTRTDGVIDPRTRLVNVIVQADPGPAGSSLVPLTPGAFVEVEIQGSPINAVASIPRRALRREERGGGEVVHAVVEGRLKRIPVEVVRRWGDVLYVRGLDDGAAVILTRLDVVAEGMPITVQETEPSPAPGSGDAETAGPSTAEVGP